MITSNF